MNNHVEEHLTSAGESRREAMLGELVHVLHRTRRHRRLRRGVVGAAGSVALIGIVVHFMPIPPHDAEHPDTVTATNPIQTPDVGTASSPSPSSLPACVTKYVQTDASAIDRYRAAPTHVVERIDDRTLLAELASINRPVGLIRYGNRVALTRPVDDASLGLRP